jgi:hypothetical protein
MSVCIASITGPGKIVVATDQMLSWSTGSFDHSVVKGDFIGLHWFAMWSASDIGPIPSILERTNVLLMPDGRSGAWSARQVANALSRAYRDEVRERAEAQFLAPFGVDFPTFLQRGAKIFGRAHQMKVEAIDQFDLDVQFLVAGFHHSKPGLFLVEPRGKVTYMTKEGHGAIGTGATFANCVLSLRGHNKGRTVGEALYSVLGAKFAAEGAPYVGKRTTVGILAPDRPISMVPTDVVAAIRSDWDGCFSDPIPRVSKDAVDGWWTPIDRAIERENAEKVEQFFRHVSPPASQGRQSSKRGPKAPPPSRE